MEPLETTVALPGLEKPCVPQGCVALHGPGGTRADVWCQSRAMRDCTRLTAGWGCDALVPQVKGKKGKQKGKKESKAGSTRSADPHPGGKRGIGEGFGEAPAVPRC